MIHLTWPNESNDILLWYRATNWALCNWSLLSWGLGIQHKPQLSCSVPLGEKGLQFQRIFKNTSTSPICMYITYSYIYIYVYLREYVLYWEQKEGCTIYIIYANWECGENIIIKIIYTKLYYIIWYYWEHQEGCTIYVIYANWGCGENIIIKIIYTYDQLRANLK